MIISLILWIGYYTLNKQSHQQMYFSRKTTAMILNVRTAPFLIFTCESLEGILYSCETQSGKVTERLLYRDVNQRVAVVNIEQSPKAINTAKALLLTTCIETETKK